MGSRKNEVTSSRHLLPFGKLSSDDFSRLCYWVVERSGEFDSVQHYDMTGTSNTFQTVLLSDGTIIISYSGIEDLTTGAITGITPGAIENTTLDTTK